MKSSSELKLIAIIALLLTNLSRLYSEDKSTESLFDFQWSLGTKGIYSSGISDSYVYNKSNIKGEMRSDYIDISAFIQMYFHYQLMDGNGNYEYRSFNEAGFSITVYLFKIINLTGEYNHADDFDNLKRDNYIGSIELDFSPVILLSDYSFGKFKYDMNSTTIETTKRDFSLQIEYNITDAFSMDIGYTYSDLYFNSLGYSYYKNAGRAGLSYIPSDYLFIIGGFSLGKDSMNYFIYSADCGITIKANSKIKFSLMYNIAYYYPPSVASSKKGGSMAGNNTNPYLTSDKAGESYLSHIVSLGMTLSF